MDTVYPKKYAHGFVVLCFVVVMQSFIMNSHEVFIHIHQGCFAGTGAIVRLPQCQWSKPDGYGKISQCIITTKHSKAKPCAYFLGYTVQTIPINLICPLYHFTRIIKDSIQTYIGDVFPYYRPYKKNQSVTGEFLSQGVLAFFSVIPLLLSWINCSMINDVRRHCNFPLKDGQLIVF